MSIYICHCSIVTTLRFCEMDVQTNVQTDRRWLCPRKISTACNVFIEPNLDTWHIACYHHSIAWNYKFIQAGTCAPLKRLFIQIRISVLRGSHFTRNEWHFIPTRHKWHSQIIIRKLLDKYRLK